MKVTRITKEVFDGDSEEKKRARTARYNRRRRDRYTSHTLFLPDEYWEALNAIAGQLNVTAPSGVNAGKPSWRTLIRQLAEGYYTIQPVHPTQGIDVESMENDEDDVSSASGIEEDIIRIPEDEQHHIDEIDVVVNEE